MYCYFIAIHHFFKLFLGGLKMEDEIFLTKEGYKQLQEKLDYLKSEKREEIQ